MLPLLARDLGVALGDFALVLGNRGVMFRDLSLELGLALLASGLARGFSLLSCLLPGLSVSAARRSRFRSNDIYLGRWRALFRRHRLARLDVAREGDLAGIVAGIFAGRNPGLGEAGHEIRAEYALRGYRLFVVRPICGKIASIVVAAAASVGDLAVLRSRDETWKLRRDAAQIFIEPLRLQAIESFRPRALGHVDQPVAAERDGILRAIFRVFQRDEAAHPHLAVRRMVREAPRLRSRAQSRGQDGRHREIETHEIPPPGMAAATCSIWSDLNRRYVWSKCR